MIANKYRYLVVSRERKRQFDESLQKKRSEKRYEKLLQRIGRLQEKSRGVSQHYRIELVTDASGSKAVALTWEKLPVNGTQLTHPGVYCLRTNELDWDEATLWQTYTMLTDLEAVFRCLKAELGLRPIYHHKQDRAAANVVPYGRFLSCKMPFLLNIFSVC